MSARPSHPVKARQAAARLYAAVAAPAPAAAPPPPPPPQGGRRPAGRPGRPARAPLGELLRGLPWAPVDRPA